LISNDELRLPVQHLATDHADLQLVADGRIDVLARGRAAATDERLAGVGSLLHDGVAQSGTLGLRRRIGQRRRQTCGTAGVVVVVGCAVVEEREIDDLAWLDDDEPRTALRATSVLVLELGSDDATDETAL